MENPEVEFLQYLLTRFIDMRDIDWYNTVEDLLSALNEELTPISGG